MSETLSRRVGRLVTAGWRAASTHLLTLPKTLRPRR